jgi:hypothetical protein
LTIIRGEAAGKEVGVQGSVSVSYSDENLMLYGENNLFRATSKNGYATVILHATSFLTWLICNEKRE